MVDPVLSGRENRSDRYRRDRAVRRTHVGHARDLDDREASGSSALSDRVLGGGGPLGATLRIRTVTPSARSPSCRIMRRSRLPSVLPRPILPLRARRLSFPRGRHRGPPGWRGDRSARSAPPIGARCSSRGRTELARIRPSAARARTYRWAGPSEREGNSCVANVCASREGSPAPRTCTFCVINSRSARVRLVARSPGVRQDQ